MTTANVSRVAATRAMTTSTTSTRRVMASKYIARTATTTTTDARGRAHRRAGAIALEMALGHDEFDHKLTLQQGRNATFYLLGELQDGLTFESMASSIATIGVTTTIDSDFVEKFLGGG